MNRLESHLNTLKKRNEKGLILYITAGDPDLNTTLLIMKELAENGADCIELGVPFSDPIADGPVIQRASFRALKNNVNIYNILELVKNFRKSHETPIVLMGYYNPIYQYGLEQFTIDFKQAGGDGLIVADLPFEESEILEQHCNQNYISLIQLLAPELQTERSKQIMNASKGFLYCVSNYGTTGKGFQSNEALKKVLTSIKEETDIPVAIGFGISSKENAVAASQMADCIIIGSWLIKELENTENKKTIAGEFTKSIKTAIN